MAVISGWASRYKTRASFIARPPGEVVYRDMSYVNVVEVTKFSTAGKGALHVMYIDLIDGTAEDEGGRRSDGASGLRLLEQTAARRCRSTVPAIKYFKVTFQGATRARTVLASIEADGNMLLATFGQP